MKNRMEEYLKERELREFKTDLQELLEDNEVGWLDLLSLISLMIFTCTAITVIAILTGTW